MRKEVTQNWGVPLSWSWFLIAVLLLGVFFRFSYLDKATYWRDETYTSLRISGYTQTELVQQVFNGNVVSIEDLQKYQRHNTEKGLIDTLQSLIVEDPQHPPLYYTMVRLWVQWFGNSVAVTRSLSALISLLAFPCIYWLCLELFESPLVGWVAIALTAVSPFHIHYAQEARQYSLWTVTILLSSAALLRSLRLKTKFSWAIYAVTVALSLYSFLFSVFFLIGHGIYVAAIERFRLSKTFKTYLFAFVAGISAFLPWALIVVTNRQQISSTTSWINEEISFVSLVREWVNNISFYFIGGDINIVIFRLPLLMIVGYAIYFLVRQTPKRVWVFILILMGSTALPLMLQDLIFGGRRTTISRYLIPCCLSIHLTVAYLLATKITSISVSDRLKKIWQITTVALISAGVWTYIIISQAPNIWQAIDSQNIPIARIVNQSTTPLLISDAHVNKSDNSIGSDGSIGDIMSLSYSLSPNVKLQLTVEPKIPKIPDGFSNVFLFNPSKALLDGIKQEYKVKLVHEGELWKLAKQ